MRVSGDGERLAGQDVARVDLGGFEGEVAAHVRLARGDPRAAGAADAALAGERQVRAGALGAVEDGRVPGQGERGGTAVEDDGDLGSPGPPTTASACSTWRGGCVVGVEQLLVDALGGDAQCRQQFLRRRGPCRAGRTATSGRCPGRRPGRRAARRAVRRRGARTAVRPRGVRATARARAGIACGTGPSGPPVRPRTSRCPYGGCRTGG